MARRESDRENLLREATALVERAELRLAGFDEPVVIGFRRDGCASVYLGADPAWHFNARNELRRAFVDGRLLKAQRRRLVALDRRRAAGEVQLLRRELNDAQTAALLARLRQSLDAAAASLAESETHHLVGQVPDEVDVVKRIRRWLTALPAVVPIAASAHAR